MIELPNVIYDIRARDGTWCKLPYPNHPKGCPNFPRCPRQYRDFLDFTIQDRLWYAVLVEFDLQRHSAIMRIKHPDWTDRQCQNLLYWQGKVRSTLRRKAYPDYPNRPVDGRLVLEIPEASGINVFETMAQVGIIIERHPNIVRKVMLIGRKNSQASPRFNHRQYER